MTYEIRELGLFEYLRECTDLRSALSDFYLKTKNCRIFGLFDEKNKNAGLLLAEPGNWTEILILAARDDDRAIKKALLCHLKKILPERTGLKWRIANNIKNETLASETGFRSGETLHLFHTVGAEDPRLTEFLTDYQKMESFMERRGYQTKCFDGLSEAELRQIRENPDREFDASLSPEALMESASGKMSFASVRDGKVAAYTIVRAPGGREIIFEIICVAESERKNGVFILPFLSSLRAMKASGAKGALFAVYDTNSQMMPMIEKRFGRLVVSCSVQHSWNCILP